VPAAAAAAKPAAAAKAAAVAVAAAVAAATTTSIALAMHPVAVGFARMTIGETVRWQAMNAHDPLPGHAEVSKIEPLAAWYTS